MFEGIFGLYDARIRDMMDLKVFVMTDDDVRLSRRIVRDCTERGRTIEGVLVQYNRFVKKAYDDFIKPTMKFADLIIPFGKKNDKGVEFIITILKSKLADFNKNKQSSLNQ